MAGTEIVRQVSNGKQIAINNFFCQITTVFDCDGETKRCCYLLHVCCQESYSKKGFPSHLCLFTIEVEYCLTTMNSQLIKRAVHKKSKLFLLSFLTDPSTTKIRGFWKIRGVTMSCQTPIIQIAGTGKGNCNFLFDWCMVTKDA